MNSARVRTWLLALLLIVPLLYMTEQVASASSEAGLFKKLIDESAMRFSPPADFSDVNPKKNSVLHYERAISHRSGELEMRFIIRPLGRISIDYEDPHNAAPEPNHLFPLLFESMINELSRRGADTHNTEYPQAQAKSLFNADWASAAVFDVNPEFTESYSQALLIAIHKDNQADAYTVFLYNESSEAKALIQSALATLSFAP